MDKYAYFKEAFNVFLASKLIGYYLTLMDIDSGVSRTVTGSTCLAKTGLSSAQTVGISWIYNFFHFPSRGWVGFWKSRYSSLIREGLPVAT